MRKALLALALTTGIPLYWQPLRGQAPSVGVKPGGDKKQKAKFSGTDSKNDQRGTKDSPLVVEAYPRPKSDQDAAEEKNEKHTKALVDGWTLVFAGLVAAFTGLLVVVGWHGVDAALRTLKGIERQTQALIDAERAWLTMDNIPNFELQAAPENVLAHLIAGITLKNCGKTMCRIKETSIRFHTVNKIEDLPTIPQYSRTDQTEHILPPDGKQMNLIFELEERILTEAMIRELRARERFLLFYVRIRYLDSHENSHIFQECYIYHCPIGGFLVGLDKEGFRRSGPQAYMEYT